MTVPSAPPPSEADARVAVLAANDRFYQAFERLDLELMGRVWSEEGSISCIHPGWQLIAGRAPVLASWAGIFRGTDRIHFDLRDPQVFVADRAAWVVLIEAIEAHQAEKSVRALAHTTNVFVLERGLWRLVHHHAASPPVEAAPPTEPARTLH